MPIRESAGKRILMITENQAYPGDNRVRHEAQALTGAGYHVSVISFTRKDQPWHETIRGVQVYHYPEPIAGEGISGYLWEFGYSLTAAFLLSLVVLFREGFDVIHAANPPDMLVFLGTFYKLFGKRFVYDHHDLAPEMYDAVFQQKAKRSVHTILLWLEKLSLRTADHVITTNESYRTVEIERGPLPPDRITVVRNGPDLNRLRIVDPDPDLKSKANTIIGYIGVMGYQDHVDYLLRALHYLRQDLGRTDWYCFLIGKGPARASLQKLTTELGLDSHVWFTGSISDEDVIRYLSTADICVDPDPANEFTSRSTMVKMMEYMTFGKPIVAFDLTEHRYTADGAAIYVQNNDIEQFARAIAELMDDRPRRKAMGALGRQRIEKQLAWDYSVPQLLSVYAQLFPDRSQAIRVGSEITISQKGIGSKIRQWGNWFSLRDKGYIVTRARALFKRYGITASKAMRRTVDCVALLAENGCQPTFPIPGRVVEHNPEFCRALQAMGAELAVHSYDHVDFRALDCEGANRQLTRAAEAFTRHHISFEGFRCPYLSWDENLHCSVPDSLFKYSSNQSIWWNVVSEESVRKATPIFTNLSRFYSPDPSTVCAAVPKFVGDRLEIPVSLPDDLQLYDGLKLGEDGVRNVWTGILHETYRRGEIFVVLFHPESFDQCALAFESLLKQARVLQPSVWVTRLQDVSQWWWEKARFKVEMSTEPAGMCLHFNCSDRATILVRNMETHEPSHPWEGSYRVLESKSLLIHGPRPFVGVSPDVSGQTVSFLKDQGYVVDESDQAPRCSIYLDGPTHAMNEVELVEQIETSQAPLVRFWRWPAGAKSALCVTGDLDALSLMDYVSRLL